MYFVYILKCGDGSFYTGYTVGLKDRIKKHNLGLASKYTRSRLPVELVYYEIQFDKSSALRRECAIKKLCRQEKISLISNGTREPSENR